MPYQFVKLEKLVNDPKKYMVVLKHNVKGVDKEITIKFGASGYKDHTIYYSEEGKEVADKKKKAYIARHKEKEDWNKSGITTSGFWSRWLLWNEKSINESLIDIKKRFF